MKHLVFAILFTASVFTAFAQEKPAEDSVLNLMREDLCTELGKIPASDFTADNFQMKLGMQMLGVFQKYNDDLVSLYGEDYATNQTTTYEIGKKIGMKLGMSCKAFQDIIMNNPELVNAAMEKNSKEKIVKAPKEMVVDAPKAEVRSFSAKVISFTAGEVSFYTVKEGNLTKRVYWIGKFTGDDELIANPAKITGKTVVFKTVESKLYNAKEKVYKKVAVIVSFWPDEIIEDQVISVEPVKN